MLSRTTLLFLIILIEGYTVLATELLAIRELVPFVGSGTEVIAIIISAVLLPLAFGYHAGGKKRGRIRATLLRNILTSLFILGLGLSYGFLELFFGVLSALKLTHPIIQTTLYALLFLARPVFLLGQTVPLVSNYFGRARLSEITGRMLFFSTVGSFCGSVFSTLVLMNTMGVHLTVIVTLAVFALLVPLLSCRGHRFEMVIAAVMVGVIALMNSPHAMKSMHIVSNNSYNTVAVQDLKTGDRLFSVNRSPSSRLTREGKRDFPYIEYIEQTFIDPPSAVAHDILVLGAGGFTVGLDDTRNRYTFVDIDPDLKHAAEAHFLPQPLGENKKFIAASARAFVRRSNQRYDLILIDTYTHILSVPRETTTLEFLQDTKKLLKPGGALVVN